MLHSPDPRTMPRDQTFPISIEGQLLGGNSDGKPRPTANMCSPGTEIVYQGKLYKDHCLNSSSPTFDGEQWVRAEFVVHGSGTITHYVNGQKVLEYEMPQYGGGAGRQLRRHHQARRQAHRRRLHLAAERVASHRLPQGRAAESRRLHGQGGH